MILRSQIFPVLITLLLIMASGCGPREEITRYKVPKPPKIAKAKSGNSGPQTGGHSHELRWEVPEGWVTVSRPGRYATFIAGQGETAVEVAITNFPGKVGGELLNINRWRRQVGAGPIDEAKLKELQTDSIRTFQVPGSHDPWKLADLLGPVSTPDAQSKRMLVAYMLSESEHSWFIKVVGSAPAIDAQKQDFEQFVRSVRMVAGSAGPPVAQLPSGDIDQYQWEAPKQWTKLDEPPMFVHTAYEMADGEDVLRMTVTELEGDGGGLAANVMRWRRMLKLDPSQPIDELKLPRIEVAGGYGIVVALQTDESLPGLRTGMVAVFAPRNGKTWVFKMSGLRSLLNQHKAQFEAWIASVRKREAKSGTGEDGE